MSRSTPSSSVVALRCDSVSNSTRACAARAVHRRSSGVDTVAGTGMGPGSGALLPVLITGGPAEYEGRRRPRSSAHDAGSWVTSSWSGAKDDGDRKSTRLNSSHVAISYAVFCLKKKKKDKH